jgi:hypothetical protein
MLRPHGSRLRVFGYSVVCCLLARGFFPIPARAEETVFPAGLAKQQEATIEGLARENVLLKEKLRTIESSPSITGNALALKNYQRLREITADVKTQRQTMKDFSGDVTWMAANLSGYARYVEAGSVAAGFARFLPIPYAGQASLLSKFVSQGILSLNTASLSIARYLTTSQQFIARAEALDPAKPAEVSDLAHFADRELLKEMNDAQQKLASVSDISTSSLSFLETLNSYIGNSDEYWSKTKSLLSGKEPGKKERSFLTENISNLQNRAGSFNAKLKLFDEITRKDGPLIKAVVAYDDLIRELGTRME